MEGESDRASAVSAVQAFLTLPAVAAFVAPISIGALDPFSAGSSLGGLVLVGVGAVVLGTTVVAFFTEGRGTLAPWDPPRRLVTAGLFGYCRNPMYVGVLVAGMGWAITFLSPLAAIYVGILGLGFHVRVVRQEEPWGAVTFPDEWPDYRANVPRWIPRLRPWSPPGGRTPSSSS